MVINRFTGGCDEPPMCLLEAASNLEVCMKKTGLLVALSALTALTAPVAAVSAVSATAVYPFQFAYVGGANSAAFSSPSVTVPAGSTASVRVTIQAGAWPDKSLSGG